MITARTLESLLLGALDQAADRPPTSGVYRCDFRAYKDPTGDGTRTVFVCYLDFVTRRVVGAGPWGGEDIPGEPDYLGAAAVREQIIRDWLFFRAAYERTQGGDQ